MNRLTKYFFVGCTAALVDLSILYCLTEFVGLFYLKSAIAAFIISGIVHYKLNKKYTFENKSKRYILQFGFAMAVACVGLLINLAILYQLVNLGLWYMFAKVIALGMVFMFTYLMNSIITYGWIK